MHVSDKFVKCISICVTLQSYTKMNSLPKNILGKFQHCVEKLSIQNMYPSPDLNVTSFKFEVVVGSCLES